jgi:inosose dehydratase
MAEVAPLAYRGIEIFDPSRIPGGLGNLPNLLKKYGLQISGFYFAAGFVDEEDAETEWATFEQYVRNVSPVGAEYLVLGAGYSEKPPSAEDFDHLFETITRAGEFCAAHGMKVAVHPHYGLRIYKEKEIDLLCERTPPGTVFLALDTAHLALAGSNPVEVLRKHRDRVVYIHLKDLEGETFVELGEGNANIDFAGFLSELDAMGYKGWLTVEQDSTRRDTRESAEISMKFLKGLINRLADDKGEPRT